jgi:chromosome partitioning protein
MRAAVLVAATAKGGAGKSTAIACLAAYWHLKGRKVALVDADSNRTLTRWHAKGDVISEITLRSVTDETLLVPTIRALAEAHDVVLVDCPGFNGQAMIFAIGAADLVLIPVMTDEANLFEALRARKMVESAADLVRRPIVSRTLLSRIRRTTVADHTRRQLEALDAQPLRAGLHDRVAFQEATFHGSAPTRLAPHSSAARDVEELAHELESLVWPLNPQPEINAVGDAHQPISEGAGHP